MSDDLRAWLEQVRDERNQAQVALQNGDDGPMRLWALRHGHVLIDKCEELAGALARIETKIYQAQLQFERRWGEATRSEAFRLTNEARKIVEDALRAPGGGGE